MRKWKLLLMILAADIALVFTGCTGNTNNLAAMSAESLVESIAETKEPVTEASESETESFAEAAAETGITAFKPADITGIISAELVFKDYQDGTVITSARIDDKEKLALLEGWMQRAVIMNGGSDCGFMESELRLEQTNGEILTLAMAGDSCNVYFVNDCYFEYRDVKDNGPFYAMFEENPIIRVWRTGYTESVPEGVVMAVVDGSVTANSISLRLFNATNMSIVYGSGYYLEKMRDGAWKRQPYIIDNLGVDSIGYTLNWKKSAQIDIDWTTAYGTIAPGDYRIVKDVLDFRSSGDYDTYEIAAEFSILPDA